ncbi:MAG TPA: MG2 domain-containing protein, partial [Opitutaceae bacterium]|nr:MG2 domain-containing protein [Opitutaceae bacterium]
MDHVYFRAVALDFETCLKEDDFDLDRDNLTKLLAQPVALAWDAALPVTADYKERTEKLPSPATLKPGLYAILSSYRPDFSAKENHLSATVVWVSDLALVLDAGATPSENAGFVLRAETGDPVAGASVRVWAMENQAKAKPTQVRTDKDGRFVLPSGGRNVLVLAEHEGQAVSNLRPNYHYIREIPDWKGEQVVFFTDRAIYRPGQNIQYKGILLHYDQIEGEYAATAKKQVRVVFKDPNGQEVAHTDATSNDYGSFSGVFTAPRDRLTGEMSLSVEDEIPGKCQVQVEEYKRPKFQVALEAPQSAAKLDGAVVVTGKATAYTGAAIGGAKVKWRVERGVQLPRWCWWWQPPASKAVAHGTATTADDGTFTVEFTAAPDRTVPAKNEPVFNYSIHADVTDTTGETRSEERIVRVGYTALQAGVSAGDWQTPDKPVELTVSAATLDGAPQVAAGTVQVHTLQQPAIVQREPLHRPYNWWWRSDVPSVDPTNPYTWDTVAVVATLPFQTTSAGTTKLATSLPAGVYRVTLTTADRFGTPVTASTTIEVVDPQATVYGVKVPHHVVAPVWSAEPGATFTALWGTGYNRGRAWVEVLCDDQVLQRFWTPADRTQVLISQPVTEEQRGGLTVRVAYVRENRLYFEQRVVQVPWTNKQLTVKWETFRSKLASGQKETWTAVVAGPDAQRASAEMVATLYDASLDQFTPLSWPDAFDAFRKEQSWRRFSLRNESADFRHLMGNWQVDEREAEWYYREFPSEVVSDVWGWQYERRKGVMMAMPCAPGGGGEDEIELSPFCVSDNAGGYAASATLAGTRIRTDLKDIGSAISVVTGQLLADMGSKNAEELLAYTTGTEVGGVAGNFVGGGAGRRPDLSKVAARKNLNETAFF